MTDKVLNLLGKEYFSEKEAAHYTCVSLDHFRRNAKNCGILPARVMGKKLYRKADIQRIIEQEFRCQHSISAASRGF